jgi:uncharacterized protein YceK
MRNIAVVLMTTATCLGGCGVMGKLDAVSNLEASVDSYKACVAQYGKDAPACDGQRVEYRHDLEEAQKTRGVLTNWRFI